MRKKLDIQIIKQPEWVTDDQIVSLLHNAHQTTLQKGMHYSVIDQNGQDIRRRIGDNGVFFVALIDNKILAGVSGISFCPEGAEWYIKGKPYAEIKLEGVREEYKGLGINGMLHRAIYDYAYNYVDILITQTATQNKIMQNADKKRGWHYVDYVSRKSTNYYSVVMAKWKTAPPISSIYCHYKYFCSKTRTRILKTRNGEYRSIFFFLYKLLK